VEIEATLHVSETKLGLGEPRLRETRETATKLQSLVSYGDAQEAPPTGRQEAIGVFLR
jgi:hypothetical protein